MIVSYTKTKKFEFHPCPTCGVVHGFEEFLWDTFRRNGQSFYCPNGHRLSYSNNEWDSMRRERDLLKQQMARKDGEIVAERRRREQAERDADAARTATKRLQKRAAAGTCPCCKRTFSALSRHMQTKHPEFRAENVVPMKAVS